MFESPLLHKQWNWNFFVSCFLASSAQVNQPQRQQEERFANQSASQEATSSGIFGEQQNLEQKVATLSTVILHQQITQGILFVSFYCVYWFVL